MGAKGPIAEESLRIRELSRWEEEGIAPPMRALEHRLEVLKAAVDCVSSPLDVPRVLKVVTEGLESRWFLACSFAVDAKWMRLRLEVAGSPWAVFHEVRLG